MLQKPMYYVEFQGLVFCELLTGSSTNNQLMAMAGGRYEGLVGELAGVVVVKVLFSEVGS
jgi:histidyl-tRNA synthetase